MPRRLLAIATAACAAFGAACVQDPVVPKLDEEPITLSLAFSRDTFRVGRPDTISVTVTSKVPEDATIRYENDCQILVTIRSSAGAAVVPPNGRPNCVPLPSLLTIPGNGSVVRRFVWSGADQFVPPGSANVLPAGTYFVSASISALNYSTVAPAVRVTLIAP